jgi:hypothetical protein
MAHRRVSFDAADRSAGSGGLDPERRRQGDPPRWTRDFTVPTGRSSTFAISS